MDVVLLVPSLFSTPSFKVLRGFFVVVDVCVLKATEVRHGPLFVFVCLYLTRFLLLPCSLLSSS